MVRTKHFPAFVDEPDPDWQALPVGMAAVPAAGRVGTSGFASVQAVGSGLVMPTVPSQISASQLDGYSYGKTSVCGSNIALAWRYSSGAGVNVGLMDDGFDVTTTATFGNFSTALSRVFGGAPNAGIGEPAGGFHGTTTAGMIGATGANNTPEGMAPNATILGVKVTFSTASTAVLAQAEQYAASVSAVVNNSWGFSGYGVGEPSSAGYGVWYSAIQGAVASGRGGLGDVVTFSAGNDYQDGNDLAVQPITADYRVIAVAASNADGTASYYSNPGAALLVAAVGDSVAVANPGGAGNSITSGTSYSAASVAAIAALMLSINPALGWRDVQEILADASYAPAPSAAGFSYNGAATWNGGGMHFSNDLGFGVVDANVAVNLARAWTEQSTSANLDAVTVTRTAAFGVGVNGSVSSSVTDSAGIRVQHVQVTINDTYLPVARSRIVLVAPDGTRSVLVDQTGLVSGKDQTGGLDVSGSVITSNAFWGESAVGAWTLQIQDIGGAVAGTIKSWSLTFLGDDAASVQSPLVYTPEFATVAAGARKLVTPGPSVTIDLIALPGATTINLNGGAGMIDGVAVTVRSGLKNANADGSTGIVTLTGLAKGGSELTGGDGVSYLNGAGGDTIYAGFGSTLINTGTGNSQVTLSSLSASTVTISSGGGDTIYGGLATALIIASGAKGDTIYDQSAGLSFVNGGGASMLYRGSGSVSVQAGSGGGTYYAGTGGGSQLMAGSGVVTFYGGGSGDVLTAAGSVADRLIAGAGKETLSGGVSTGSITLQAGSGTDTLIAGKGKTTFIVGTGNSSITMGGKSGIVQVQSGQAGGLNTVSGFRLGIDDLHLVSFAVSAATNAINGQKSDGRGGTLLTFADNTRIDLLGVAKASSGYFA